MIRFTAIFLSFLTFITIAPHRASAADELVLDHKRDAVNLNGQWQIIMENGEAEVWEKEVADTLGGWKTVTVPGSNLLRPDDGKADDVWKKLNEKIKTLKCVWVRRSITLDEKQAARNAVIRWGGIKWGATVWINGTEVARHVPVSPHQALLPAGLLNAGANDIVIKVPGWGGIPRSASGFPLFPAGAGTQSWGGKGPGIYDDIWLEFYDTAYAKWILTIPDVAEKTATFRIWMDAAGNLPASVTVKTVIREKGKTVEIASVTKELKLSGKPAAPQDVVCTLTDVKPWTHETPDLYEATVTVMAGDKICDKVTFTFGMRTLGIKDGDFTVNNRPLWLRGSDLLNEWNWGEGFKGKDNAKKYIVDEARSMNLNCFRTHTVMPPAAWLDVADEYGTMILAESPLLYNGMDFGFTPAEYAVFHKNALDDITGWITRMWNHPAIVFWVISNESMLDGAWEASVLYDHVKALDPTRFIMRTGDHRRGTRDVLDIHSCFNMKKNGEGSFQREIRQYLDHRDPAVPISNTEYMNLIGSPSRKMSGVKNGPAWPLIYAETATEHTEFMRRKEFDCLLPYMYARWSRMRGREEPWRPEFAHPVGAALHSSMAPVLASLHLFNRNFATASTVTTDMDLINETGDNVKATLTIYVTPHNPVYLPDADSLKAAVSSKTSKLTLKAYSHTTQQVTIPVPQTEGTYYVAAVLERKGAKPVVSQREIHAVDAAASVAPLKGRKVLVLGGDVEMNRWLQAAGADLTHGPEDAEINADAVLLWNLAYVDNGEHCYSAALKRYMEKGGRIIIAEQPVWSWKTLDSTVAMGTPASDFTNTAIGSRAHRADSTVSHPALKDLPQNWLWRWNGNEGIIADKCILESSLSYADMKKLLWVSKTNHITLASLPRGKGELLISQLKFKGRLDRNAEDYDPVAERMLVNLLTK